jgi:HK97 family phage portal protein
LEVQAMNIPIISKIFKARDKPSDYYTGSNYTYLFGPTTSGKSVNEFTAMQTTAVYSCVRILSEALASLPLHIYRYKEGGKERVYDHPLYHILHDEPNSEMTSFVFRETLMSHLLIWGNAYVQVIRDGAGRVLGLYPLLPNKVNVGRDKSGEIFYTYARTSDENPNFKDYGTVVLRKQDVLHIPGLGFDGLVGYSPIAMAKNAVGMTLACEEYGASFFANGANPGGVLEHPGVLKDPKKVRDSWNEVYRGTNNAHKVAVLEEGMKYQQIGIPPEEAQFLETRKFQINEIARLYRIPPHMVGDLEKSSFSNIEQQSLEFVKYTLDPWVIRWEQALQRSLLLPKEKSEYFIKLNVDGLLRGDYQSRMNGYSIGRQNGWLSANDIREMEDMNSISEDEGGDLYLINGNMTKLKDAGAFANTGEQSTGNSNLTERK